MLMVATERVDVGFDSAKSDKWCMIAVRPGKEPDCADSFRRNGVECYWPNYYTFETLLRGQRPFRRGRKEYRAVIPGYIFSPLPMTMAFERVMRLNEGLLHVVRKHSGDLLVMDYSAVEVIEKIEAGLNTPKPKASLHNFMVGQKVWFCDDLVNRWPPGLISRALEDGKIVVETEFMGRRVPIIVFPHQITRK